ncbi:MAG: hypothetical protein KC589_01755 [Nanoarchaeota archaeon]|nr:hypothetical protein [Nanoarchaeota archaeon]
MLKKIFIFLIFGLFFLQVGFAQECDFYSNTCDRISSPFVTFDVAFDNEVYMDKFEAEIYNKKSPANKIRVEIDEVAKTVRNLNPFMDPAVYVLKVRAFNLGSLVFEEKTEFIFDNKEPLPPIVPLNLQSDGASILVEGKTQFKNSKVVVLKADNSQAITGVSGDDGSFSLNIPLVNGINYVKFFVEGKNGIKSQIVERMIIGGGKIELKKEVFVSSLNIDGNLNVVNGKTVKNGDGSYTTSKRNFYVSGSGFGGKGAQIFVNGVPAIFDGSKFGAFLLLNEGANLVKVKSGSSEKSFTVYYDNFKFLFEDFRFYRFVKNSASSFEGDVNYNLPFNLYLNGKFLKSIVPENENFRFDLSAYSDQLVKGKNYIYLEGLNNQRINDVFYYDTESPSIEVLSFEETLNSSYFVFRVGDDVGVNFSSLSLVFDGGIKYDSSLIEVWGDLCRIRTYGLFAGIHDYQISISDFTGKDKTISGSVDLSASNVVIDSFYIQNGYDFGNYLFVKDQMQTIILTPSKNIVFKKIYLDGVDQINYRILDSGEVQLDIDFSDMLKGELKFIYYDNSKLKEFSQIYNYVTSAEEAKLDLDYIYNAQTSQGRSIFVSGEISDSHFNWSSLDLGYGIENRIGNYFEAYIEPSEFGNSNLHVLGNDYSSNGFDSNNYFYSVLYMDVSVPQLALDNNNVLKDYISGSFQNAVDDTRKEIYMYDGFSSLGNAVDVNYFDLPAQERFGLRSINMRGVESSKLTFTGTDAFSLDPLEPRVYLVRDGSGKYILLADGTLSEIVSFEISVDGSPASTSWCDHETAVYSDCYEILDDLQAATVINVEVVDKAGNVFNRDFRISDLSSFDSLTKFTDKSPEIYFNGNDFLSNNPSVFLQGQIISSAPITDVNIDGRTCSFDDYNFICYVSIDFNTDSFTLTVTDLNDRTSDEEIVVLPPPGDGDGDKDPDNDLDNDGITNDVDPDIDGDGLDNWNDPDDDNDGVDDNGDVDDDNDGIRDNVDLDTDNDLDNDGIDNGADNDDDGDGIPDNGDPDNDNDGIPDPIDPDDDNDGIPDHLDPDTQVEPNDPIVIVVDNKVDVDLLDVYGNFVFKMPGNYLISTNRVNIDGTVGESAAISVLIGGEEVLMGSRNGDFTLNVDLTSQTNGEDKKEFEVWLKAEDESGNVGFSKKVKLIYDRVLKTLISIVVS